ncbi:MAG: excinuclease ABC subunit UvrA [Burkholderiaceae bacterium]
MTQEPERSIRIRGARTHNLRNLNLDLPRDRLVVITGPSGSGKSSLAFDTLYAEGQRRYVESLSAYARQFLERMDKPDVDLIEGLSPAIAIEQKAAASNPRSTVGTVTEIHDYLRLLYARAGTPYCPNHPGQALRAQSLAEMAEMLLDLAQGQRIMILSPVEWPADTPPEAYLESLRGQGFVRIRLVLSDLDPAQSRVLDLDPLPRLPEGGTHRLEVVVDRLRVQPGSRQRLVDSLETALRLSGGRAAAAPMDETDQARGAGEPLPSTQAWRFSNRYACPICNHALSELEPRLFSFNSPAGACPDCDGLGTCEEIDVSRVVAFPDLGLAAGALLGWDRRNAFSFQVMQSLAAHYGFDLETPFAQLPESVQNVILHGSGSQKIAFVHLDDGGRAHVDEHAFEGVLPNLERRLRETSSPAVREELGRCLVTRPCRGCDGTRLGAAARHVRIGHEGEEVPIATVSGWTLARALGWFESLELPGARGAIGERLIREIANRLRFLVDVGLPYLSLERPAQTLSGGEAQRIRLASQIGSGLSGVMYVLDEPSIGLHQRDNARLLETLRRLRDLGNSVIVVEHDEEAIRSADHVVDLGPGAGEQGGQLVAQGTPAQIEASQDSLTGLYLSGQRRIQPPGQRRAPRDARILVRGARGNNLDTVDAAFPVGLLTCVTGVSGSGKSTLVNETLLPAALARLNGARSVSAPHDRIEGLEHLDKVIAVDQSPIGRTPRSNPATYTGLFTPIRELFAQTSLARERGYGPGRFSFNVRGGRCEACEGDGVLRIEMHFLPDVHVPCDRCNGRRYNRETLDVQYKGRNIAEVLEMTVLTAIDFFDAVPAIARRLQTLADVGLGYLRLGQAGNTLSGGEAQRVKLSQELSRRDTGRTLYILDEPTTGLHFHDIELLLGVIQSLCDQGNTVIIIEHNLDVILCADWIIDLGPEGGAGGGRIVACGTPEEIAACPDSRTGVCLSQLLARQGR